MSLAVSRQNSESESAEHEHEEEEGGAEIGALSAGLMGGGRPLDDGTRSSMEGSFGADFSAVRVHQDSAAAAGVGAQAFTQGADIHFAPGQYNPGSASGRELIGHELAHVVQQGGSASGAPQAKGANLGGSAALEHEADVAGAAAARGERARVSGVGSGIQFKGKKPVDRSWLNAAKLAESGKIAQAHVEELKKRLAAKCELRFTNTDDGKLIEDLETAASNKVKDVAATELSANPTQKGDVEALSAKIAQRSKAVKNAVSERSRSIANALGQNYLAAFKAATDAAFDNTSVSKLSIKSLVIQQAIVSAKVAAGRLDESQYQDAKEKLDEKLSNEAVQLKTDLTQLTETKVETRAKQATDKRKDPSIDQKVTRIAQDAHTPVFKSLHDEVEKYVSHGLGVGGVGWLRSNEVREFRDQMKQSARKQAVDDIDTEMGNQNLGKAKSRYVGMEAKLEAYDEAKHSVDTALDGAATKLTNAVFTDKKVAEGLLDAARRAAFAVYEDEGHQAAATNAAVAAARAHGKAIHDAVMEEARTRKNAIVKPATPNPTVRTDVEKEVVQQVETDHVGQKSVQAAIKGSSPEEGMSKFGHFLDFMVPERGDTIKFKVTLEVPAGPGNVLIEFQGDAERGTRERLIQKDQSGNKVVSRDTQSLKFAAEIRVGYSGSFPGIKVQGALGFFMRSDAASTDMCMKALSYGIYRFLTGAIPPLANLWGGSSKKAQGMAEADPNSVDDDLSDDVYRSELWAAMIEEEVFKKDKEARVDLGMSLSGGGEVDGGVAKAKGSLRFEGMRTYDKKALKDSIRKYNSTHTGQQVVGGVSLGDDKFDKQGAKERREAISGRTTGAFMLESEVEVEIGGQKSVFGLKVKIAPPDWEVEISGGIKLSSSDPASKEARLYAGIASASQNGLKAIISLIRNLVDKDHAVAGIAGSLTDGVTRTMVDVNNITNNQVGDMTSKAYQVEKGQEDIANEGINKFLGGETKTQLPKEEGIKGPGSDSAPETKAGFQSESTYKVAIVFGNVKQFMLKVDEVQTQKVKVGGPGGPGLNVEYEKSRRVGQIGVSGGRFHAEGMGVSTKT